MTVDRPAPHRRAAECEHRLGAGQQRLGRVARIQTFNSMKDTKTGDQGPGTTLVLHEAIPSKVILHLVKRANAAAAK